MAESIEQEAADSIIEALEAYGKIALCICPYFPGTIRKLYTITYQKTKHQLNAEERTAARSMLLLCEAAEAFHNAAHDFLHHSHQLHEAGKENCDAIQ